MYFGFSYTVNVAMGGMPGSKGRALLEDAIRAVPTDRIMIESDVSSDVDAPGACAKAVELVASVRGWSYEHTAELTSRNGLAFFELGGGGVM